MDVFVQSVHDEGQSVRTCTKPFKTYEFVCSRIDWPSGTLGVTYIVIRTLTVCVMFTNFRCTVGYTVLWYQLEGGPKSCRCFDRLVFFRANIARDGNVQYLWPHIASFTVTKARRSISGCQTCLAGDAFPSSQGSHPRHHGQNVDRIFIHLQAGAREYMLLHTSQCHFTFFSLCQNPLHLPKKCP